MNFERMKILFNEAKLIIGTIALVVTSIIGSYHFASEYFVTTIYAQEIIQNVKDELTQLKLQTKALQRDVVESKLIRLENKMFSGNKLTPTELRQYDVLLNKYKD